MPAAVNMLHNRTPPMTAPPMTATQLIFTNTLNAITNQNLFSLIKTNFKTMMPSLIKINFITIMPSLIKTNFYKYTCTLKIYSKLKKKYTTKNRTSQSSLLLLSRCDELSLLLSSDSSLSFSCLISTNLCLTETPSS